MDIFSETSMFLLFGLASNSTAWPLSGYYLSLDVRNSFCIPPGLTANFLKLIPSSFLVHSLVLMEHIHLPIVMSSSKVRAMSEGLVIFPLNRPES